MSDWILFEFYLIVACLKCILNQDDNIIYWEYCMQRFELEIKGPVWSKLKDIFNKYSGGS